MDPSEQLLAILAEVEAISTDDLRRVKNLHQQEGGSFAALLIRESLISEEDLFFLMSRRLGVSAIPEERLLHLALSPGIRRRVSKLLAMDCLIVPLDLDLETGCLSVAMFDPTDTGVLERLRQESRVAKIQAYLARRAAILEAVEAAYGDEEDSQVADELEDLPQQEAKVEIDPSLAREIASFEEMAAVKVEEMAETDIEEKTERKMLSDREIAKLKSMHPGTGDSTDPFELTPVDDEQIIYMESNVEEETLEREITQVRAAVNVSHAEDHDALFRELLSSVGILVSMLEERIDPTGGLHQEYGRLSRLVARQLGLDEVTIARVALAAHLYGLDLALRRELGKAIAPDVAAVFSSQPTSVGGLGPSLRALGARALGYVEESNSEPIGLRLIRLVKDFLELRAESDKGAYDMDTVIQLLRAGGRDSALIDALVQAIETIKTPQIKIYGTHAKGDD